MVTQQEYECPICRTMGRGFHMQTKEHFLKGECPLTETIGKEELNNIARKLVNWNIKHETMVKILTTIKQEWEDVQTNYYEAHLEEHAKSAALIGLWGNKVVQQIIHTLVKNENWTEEISMERVIELVRIQMKDAVKLMKQLKENREGYLEDITDWETLEYTTETKENQKLTDKIQKEQLTNEEVQAFKQRWTLATRGKKIKETTKKLIDNRKKVSKKELAQKEREEVKKDKMEQKKRKLETQKEEDENTLKRFRGGGELQNTIHEKRCKHTTPRDYIPGGSRDYVHGGE